MSGASEFREYLQQLVRDEARPPHKFDHQTRLYRLCRKIGESLAYDDDVVFAAVWLHDLGVFDGNRPSEPSALVQWDHVSYAVDRTRAILAETSFPADRVEAVVAVIRQHQPQDTPTSLEATIVRDADILEQLGAVTVLRTAAKLGRDTRFVEFSDVYAALERQLTTLPALLRLPKSQTLAVSRVAALRGFLDSLSEEAGIAAGAR